MDKINSISELTTILNSRVLKEVLDKHNDFLQKEVFRYVREQNITKAYGELCKLEDFDRIIKLLTKRFEDLKKEK